MSMHNRILFSIPLLLAFAALPLAAISACDPQAKKPSPPPDGGGGAAPEPAAGCTGRRWIGKFRDGACPELPKDSGWSNHTLFQSDEGVELEAPAFLAEYCVYEYKGNGKPDPAEIAALQAAVAAKSEECTFAEDCVTVGPLGGNPAEVDATRQVLHDEFIDQVNGEGLPPVNEGATLATVRVAVVDTKAGSQRPVNPHGTVIGGLIRDLTCLDPRTRCAAEVVDYLGLPHIDNIQQRLDGGHFGSMSQVAAAIYRAVTAWQWQNYAAPNAVATTPRLVINASIGTQPGSDCGATVGTLSCSAQSAFDALRHAACQGAIVVAAAGNSPGGPDRIEPVTDDATGTPSKEAVTTRNEASALAGATCPAAWTRLLSRNECEGLEGKNYDDPLIAKGFAPFSSGSSGAWLDTPLLVPVAGADSSDALLPNVRNGSLPRNVALGTLGTATDDIEMPPSFPPPMTGSSLGAASWTATAANVWAYDPRLTARDIIDLLYASGRPIQDTSGASRHAAVDWDSAAQPEVKRARVCNAVSQVCNSNPPPATCPTQPISCPRLAPVHEQNRDLSVLAPEFGSLFNMAPKAAVSAVQNPPPPPFEKLQNFSTPPWVHPQPETFPCGNCALYLSASMLYIYIDPQFPSTSTIKQATLVVNDNKGNRLGSFVLDHTGMSANTTKIFGFTMAPNLLSHGIAQAVMSFQVESNNAIASSTGTILLIQ
jgi:hypothetical protein